MTAPQQYTFPARREDHKAKGDHPMLQQLTSFVLVSFLLAAVATCSAAQYHAPDSGDWSTLAWEDEFGALHGSLPGAGDDVYIGNGYNVAYDLSGSNTYGSISVSGASTFGYKLQDGVNDSREIRLTGDLSLPGNIYDQSRLYIGGTYGGSSIEAGDDLKLIFVTDGAGLKVSGGRARVFIEGYSESVRNVEIAGAGGGVNAVVNSAAGRRGLAVNNTYFHDFSQLQFTPDGNEGGTREIRNNLIVNTAAPNALITGGPTTVDNNTITTTGNGISGLPAVFSNNSVTRGSRGGKGVSLGSYPGSNKTITGNSFSGFDKAFDTNLRLTGVTFSGNQWDNNNTGIEWRTSHNTCTFNSVGDVFGGSTANGTYDLQIQNNGKDSYHNLDGTVLASDADPINEFHFQFNNSYKTYAAWRDFDGVNGDYRVWSSDNGLLWSDMVYAPRTTDTLTLEKDSAYSNATPTTLTLTGEATVAGVDLDAGTTLLPAGNTLNTGTLTGAGTLDLGGSSATVNQSGNSTFSGQVTSSGGGLAKGGAGTLTLNNPANDYSGGTQILAGMLVAADAGALGSGDITVNGGTFSVASGVTVTNNIVATAGTITGEGKIGTPLSVGSGTTLSPGASPGTIETVDEDWLGGGTFLFEIRDYAGTAGSDPGWDLLLVDGVLDIQATAGDTFEIDIVSWNTIDGSTGLANWPEYGVFDFLFVDSTNTISGFAAESFTLDTSGFLNPKTSWNILPGTEVAGGGETELYLRATVIPEPASFALLAVAALAALRRRLRA
jgi:autotransporter-associated beta strand protein